MYEILRKMDVFCLCSCFSISCCTLCAFLTCFPMCALLREQLCCHFNLTQIWPVSNMVSPTILVPSCSDSLPPSLMYLSCKLHQGSHPTKIVISLPVCWVRFSFVLCLIWLNSVLSPPCATHSMLENRLNIFLQWISVHHQTQKTSLYLL